jgi:hypothetical protein
MEIEPTKIKKNKDDNISTTNKNQKEKSKKVATKEGEGGKLPLFLR